MDRRTFCYALSTGCFFAAKHAMAMGEDSFVRIGLLNHGGGDQAKPQAVEQLLWEVSKRTSIRVMEKPVNLALSDPNLFYYPLIVWIGVGEVPPLTDQERLILRRYLRGGGTLFIDDASPAGDDRFHRCVEREMKVLWPKRPWERFGNDHTIYRSFYLLEYPGGRIDRQRWLEGVTFDDRSPVIYGRNDLFGAFSRDDMGAWSAPMAHGGRRQREFAFRLGINLIMYALCLNYKRDQVHVTSILRRRKWRVEPPKRVR
ncbi:MAG: DUF4159 domain-containing protein [Myxococcota bacterium]|nr:DUF4159 domain-containing protein [Myxococcota bacterium]